MLDIVLLIAVAVGIILFCRYVSRHKELIIVKGDIESYIKQDNIAGRRLPNSRIKGYLKEVTLKNTETGERTKFPHVTFTKNLWDAAVSRYDFTNHSVIFCAERIDMKHIVVFALDDVGYNKDVFYKDLDPPYSIVKIFLNFFIRFILAFLALVTESDPFILVAFILIGYSTYSYIRDLTQQKAKFAKKLALIKEAGIPEPLK